MMKLIADNFAGGGGASIGIEAALGRSIDIAINHDDYILDPLSSSGRPLSKSAQIRMIGNSVCPDVAEAIVRANFPDLHEAGLLEMLAVAIWEECKYPSGSTRVSLAKCRVIVNSAVSRLVNERK